MSGLNDSGTILGTATNAKSGTTVTVNVNGAVVTIQVARDLSVVTGDVLLIQKFGAQWVAVQRLYSTAPGSVDNGQQIAPPATTTSGTLTVAPVETRSYRNGSWRTDNTSVYQGQYGGNGNHIGAVFYGDRVRSLAGATITSVTVQVRRISGGIYAAQQTTMFTHPNATRPAGTLTLSNQTSGPSLAVDTQTGSFSLPTAWAAAMAAGTVGGIAFFTNSGTPYVRFAGLGDWSPAFTMTINWTR